MRQAMNISRQPEGGDTVASDYLRLLASGAESRGVDMESIWRATQIDPAILGVRGARVGWATAERVWEQVMARVGDPLFGLELAEAIPFGAANLIDYLVLSSADIGAALGKLARYAPLINEADRMSVVASGDRASMRFQIGSSLRQHVEMVVALFVRRARELFGPSWAMLHVSFAHAAQGPLQSYQRVLKVPIHFDCPITEAVFPRELLALPMAGADSALNASLTAQAEELLAAIKPRQEEASFVALIERTLEDGLAKGDLTLMRLANQMGLSIRTVQRRLRAAGLTHRELVRGLRHKLAKQSLDAPISQGEIARTLGYSGTGAFQRAFKRWSGIAPGQLREHRARARRRR
jgi:AraC-like DNA-binding protein